LLLLLLLAQATAGKAPPPWRGLRRLRAAARLPSLLGRTSSASRRQPQALSLARCLLPPQLVVRRHPPTHSQQALGVLLCRR
jgi:hypothetical protein